MRLAKIFHAVKAGTPEEKVAFWRLCKTAAAVDGTPVALGLTKIALDIWADSYESGMSPGSDRSTREAFAGSFGSAAAAEGEFAKWVSAGMISDDEHAKLASWVAEGAVNDLVELTKTAGVMDVLRKPQVMGAITGTVIGAGIGAWKDDDNRARGAIMGAIPGAVIGAALGHDTHVVQAGNAANAATQAFQREAQRGRGQGAVDAYMRAASVWKDPSLADHIKQHAETIAQHHAAGHMHMPEVMNAVLKNGPERNAFMARVAKFMPHSPKTASVQAKLADVMQGLDQGGQPPMNADAPQMPPGDQGQGEAIASPDQGQAEAMEGVDRAHKIVDNMIFLAQQVQLPQLAQEMEQNRESLASHFADGNVYLPPELQHHFAQSEHAEAFMKKYKQRFGAPSVGGGKKTAGIRDWLEHKGVIGNKANPMRHGWHTPEEGEIPEIHLSDEQLQTLTPQHAQHLLQQPINYSPASFEKLHALSQKTAGVMESLKQQVDSFRGLAPGGVDMEEVRKYIPDAQYAGMVPMGKSKQPGLVAEGGSRMMTWDPEQVRHQRGADPRGFYQSFASPQAPPAVYHAYQQMQQAQAAAAGAPKTAAAQDEWLSWRTRR